MVRGRAPEPHHPRGGRRGVLGAFLCRLGPKPIVASYPDYARFLAPQGDTTLSLHRVGQPCGREPAGPTMASAPRRRSRL